MEAAHKLIVHGLIKFNGKYLVIKRTAIKRGKQMPTRNIGIFRVEWWNLVSCQLKH